MGQKTKLYLKRIIATKLLSFDADTLSVLVSRLSVSRKGNNSIVRDSRSNEQMEKDYRILERRAEDLTDGGISCHHGYFHLSDLIDEYEAISKSRLVLCKSPFNTVPLNMVKLTETLANSFCHMILGANLEEEEIMIMQELGYYYNDTASFIGNYRGSIGLLLLMKLLPSCNEKSRFRDNKDKLAKDTISAQKFITTLRSKLGQPTSTYRKFVERMVDSFLNDSWQRLSLIFWFTREIDYLVISLHPEALIEFTTPFNERVQRIPEFKESFFYLNDQEEHFFKITPANVSIANESIRLSERCYLYDYHNLNGKIESTRYSVRFFKNRVALITKELSQISSVLLGKDGTQFEAEFDYYYDECQLRFNRKSKPNAIPFGNLSLQITTKPNIIFPEPHEENIVEPVACLGAIFDNGRLLLNGYTQRYLVEANRENGLDCLFPYLNIKDVIGIYRMEDSGKDRLYLYYEKGCRKAFEITTEADKSKYGIQLLAQ